jgi:hypothetical protein
VAVGEAETFGREGIDVRTGIAVIAVTAEVVGSERININVEEVHMFLEVRGQSTEVSPANEDFENGVERLIIIIVLVLIIEYDDE